MRVTKIDLAREHGLSSSVRDRLVAAAVRVLFIRSIVIGLRSGIFLTYQLLGDFRKHPSDRPYFG
jgi:hypothetical protein